MGKLALVEEPGTAGVKRRPSPPGVIQTRLLHRQEHGPPLPRNCQMMMKLRTQALPVLLVQMGLWERLPNPLFAPSVVTVNTFPVIRQLWVSAGKKAVAVGQSILRLRLRTIKKPRSPLRRLSYG
ncbi:hypothetical protein NQZ68_040161 [Dissostichus eleginoides]|nr:hypothetical protein NQZ68_040161 [Dissostichus eleginoides]